jgi:hypothetical protein
MSARARTRHAAGQGVRNTAERDWQQQVQQLATLHGWRWFHDNDSRRNPAGLPDLLMVKGSRLLAVELKTETGRVRPEQTAWLDALAATGAETAIWRPSDIEHVQSVLSGRTILQGAK